MKRSLIAIVMTSVLLVGMFAGAGTSVRAATVIGPQNVSHDGEQSILPRVAQDPDGNVHVVWDEEGDRRVVYAKGTWNGSAYDFGPKYVVTEIDDGFRFATPNVAVAPNGTIMVTWSTADGAFAQVWDSRAAGPGNAPVQVGEGIQSAIAADSDSRFHMVFNGDFLIQYCLFDGSGGCARYDVFGAGDTNNNPDIVADTNGAVHIVWHTGSSGVQYIVRAKDQDWGAITRLDGGNFATIGADGQGYVHIAWSRDFNVQYCRKTAANICEERRELSTGDDIRPSIGATPAGDVLLVYLDNQSKTLQYITRENDSWSDPGVLINTNTPPDVPGRTYVRRSSVTWSGDYDIQLSTLNFAPAPTPVPPTPVPPTPTPLPPDARCFPETGYCIFGRIRQFWESNGGLAVFGYPISVQARLTTLDGTFDLQLFERERLELHPENQPPFDVLLGRLGGDLLYEQGRPWETLPREQPQNGCLYFAETQHNVCEPFLSYWRSIGIDLGDPGVSYGESLLLFGLPITTRAVETNPDGATVETQWFERARFEYHPNNPEPFRVLLGRLGAEAGLP